MRPKFEYGCVVWGSSYAVDIGSLEQVQNRMLHYLESGTTHDELQLLIAVHVLNMIGIIVQRSCNVRRMDALQIPFARTVYTHAPLYLTTINLNALLTFVLDLVGCEF